MVIGIK